MEHQKIPGNYDDNLAVHGYDVVSYHDDKPLKGSKDITVTLHGITYRFANEANKDRFNADPMSFQPAYGGWCAYAMADGDQVDIDPKTFTIIEGKTYLFYNGF